MNTEDQLALDQLKDIRDRTRKDPVWFMQHFLGARPWAKQSQIARSVFQNRITAVASCHGSGKSFTAGRIVPTFLLNFAPSIVITTAPTNRQVKEVLWKEIHAAHEQARVDLGGTLLQQQWRIERDWFALGFTATNPDSFSGVHSNYVLIVVDEAAGVAEPIFDPIMGVISSGFARLLLIGNPTSNSGYFKKAFRDPRVSKVMIPAWETPNFTHYGVTLDHIRNGDWKDMVPEDQSELPMPTLITPHAVADFIQPFVWGEHSPAFQSRICARFPDEDDDTLIPLTWVESAQELFKQLEEDVPFDEIRTQRHSMALDVGGGTAESVLVERKDNRARTRLAFKHKNTMATAGIVARVFRESGARRLVIDTIGIGRGVGDRLKELKLPVVFFDGSAAPVSSVGKKTCRNLRAECYWLLRTELETQSLAIDDRDIVLQGQLPVIKFKITSGGLVQIESKDEMRRRGFVSPDRADAYMMAMFDRPAGGGKYVVTGEMASIAHAREFGRGGF